MRGGEAGKRTNLICFFQRMSWDFAGGPVVKNPPAPGEKRELLGVRIAGENKPKMKEVSL